MRPSLIKPLRAEFKKSLQQRLKTVVRVPLHPATAGSMAWLIGENESANAYVILFVSKRSDEFTIEVAWSKMKRIPPKQDWEPQESSKSNESRFRLSRLWQIYGGEVWYDLNHDEDLPEVLSTDPFPDPFGAQENVCVQRIPVKVKRALDAFEEHGLPYLRKAVGLPV